MRYFQYTDYGFLDAYSIVINGNQQWLKDHPDEARKFVKPFNADIRLLPTTRTRPRRISSTRTPEHSPTKTSCVRVSGCSPPTT